MVDMHGHATNRITMRTSNASPTAIHRLRRLGRADGHQRASSTAPADPSSSIAKAADPVRGPTDRTRQQWPNRPVAAAVGSVVVLVRALPGAHRPHPSLPGQTPLLTTSFVVPVGAGLNGPQPVLIGCPAQAAPKCLGSMSARASCSGSRPGTGAHPLAGASAGPDAGIAQNGTAAGRSGSRSSGSDTALGRLLHIPVGQPAAQVPADRDHRPDGNRNPANAAQSTRRRVARVDAQAEPPQSDPAVTAGTRRQQTTHFATRGPQVCHSE
jgi:hypothetical protein